MTDSEFWKLIEKAKKRSDGDDDELIELLRASLVKLPADEIVSFSKLYDEHRFKAYRWDLWGAAYLMNGGCSDDGFEYFRGWLISRGRKVYEAALADPDSLADVVDPDRGDHELEDMMGVARYAYEEKTGDDLPDYESTFPDVTGKQWAEEELDALFPRLAAKTNG